MQLDATHLDAARLDGDTCYRALRAKDTRFDGRFFVGVSTTGVYCRPICPARTPRRDRCTFYRSAAEAERAGFRACLRCRPEVAPGSIAPVDATSVLLSRAVARIDDGYLDEHGVPELAAALGVSDRHLRRVFSEQLGVTPKELSLSRRLALAKQLLHDSDLSLTEIALASGFGSVRRFNATFRQRFERAPSSLRSGRRPRQASSQIPITLGYRPPLAWRALLAFVAPRVIEGVEHVDHEAGRYLRTLRFGRHAGVVEVRDDSQRARLQVHASLSLAPALPRVVTRLRTMFDLDAQPTIIDAHLSRFDNLRPLVEHTPGLRIPGSASGFEMLARAILGQQVSVAAATTLAARLCERFGETVEGSHADGQPWRLFPEARVVAKAAADEVAAIGLPAARARALVAAAEACAAGLFDDPVALRERLVALPGVGEWTAEYVTMRASNAPDALPASDLVLRQALEDASAAEVRTLAEPWRPWRSYAVLHLWNTKL
ncbi:MAG: helix-turn-helix domain-containing protein [Myxococcales bacterium]|nr:helix-turn-helix domain-containing protein [Myxococcales bacterium]